MDNYSAFRRVVVSFNMMGPQYLTSQTSLPAPGLPPLLGNHYFRIYAHRGSTLLAPENTAAAFDLAINLGADVLETDVRLSADNRLIVTHDATLERTTDATGPVCSLPASALAELDAGYRTVSLDGRRWARQGIRLMTLDELFESYPETAINIDIKDNSMQAPVEVAACVRRHGRESDTTTGSFHSAVIRQFRRVAPALRTAATLPEVASLYFSRRRDSRPEAYQAIQIPIRWYGLSLMTQGFINRVQRKPLELCYWTINDEALMIRLARMGIDGIVTDRPDLAASVRKECCAAP